MHVRSIRALLYSFSVLKTEYYFFFVISRFIFRKNIFANLVDPQNRYKLIYCKNNQIYGIGD